MADPRFYRTAGPFSVADLAVLTGAAVAGAGHGDLVIHGLAPLETAGPSDLSFLSNRRYVAAFEASRAGAIFVAPDIVERAPRAATLLVTDNPYLAQARASAMFHPLAPITPGIAPSAFVDPTALLGEGVAIGHHAVVEAGVEIGAGSSVGANSVIGPGVRIGIGCCIESNVTVTHCLMGDRVRLMPGVRLGQDGFGYVPDPSGHIKVPQLGRVIIEDDVEISANVAIDRGSGPDTVIGAGTKIDNLVHIGHNVTLGRGCLITGQVGMAGSAKLGNFVSIGGQAGVSGHIKVGDGAQIAAQSGLMSDVEAGATMMGSPAFVKATYFRQLATLVRLTKGKGR